MLPLGIIATFAVLAATCNDSAVDVGSSVNWQPRTGAVPPEDTPQWVECQMSGPYGQTPQQYYTCGGNATLELFYSIDAPHNARTIKRPRPGNPDGQSPTKKLWVWNTQPSTIRCRLATAPCSGNFPQNTPAICIIGTPAVNEQSQPVERQLYTGILSDCY